MEKLIAINGAHPQHTKKVPGALPVAPTMLRMFSLEPGFAVSPGHTKLQRCAWQVSLDRVGKCTIFRFGVEKRTSPLTRRRYLRRRKHNVPCWIVRSG
ncbi:hypothetical protein [Paraburkholderia sp. BL6669N2]|uniref:hypothetical protein n=1 Tax=Paraburkholderia sp. BL6669N2 TaxID=1938807 RepID=UPI0015F277CC|nr:hypothetical protein [Paraburkholderia sp. BL6669N2]